MDIGGEGRYPDAWNLNPSRTRTLGPSKGSSIPRHIQGKAEAIPLRDRSVELIVMERAPLRRQSIHEILRVISIKGTIVLRHFESDEVNPHAIAHQIIQWLFQVSQTKTGGQDLQRTIACASWSQRDTRKLQNQATEN